MRSDEELVERALDGHVPSVSRLISRLETRGREGDPIHPAEVSRVLVDLFPNSEMILLTGEEELVASIRMLVDRVGSFLTGVG